MAIEQGAVWISQLSWTFRKKNKFLHPVGFRGVCREECSSVVHLCRPDIFNYICGADSKFVTPVNSGEIGAHAFWINYYYSPKCFKIITLKAQ